jgi:uncharacterized protein YdhG (YjbR/CyaY superfamily)
MINNDSARSVVAGGVGEYIARCPKDVQAKLEHVRSAIREVVPDAIETVSYFDMPGYCYQGYNYNGMFVWFSYKPPYIRLHVRPPVIQDHEAELKEYARTKAILSFPQDAVVPTGLIKKLTRASLKVMKDSAE